MGLNGVTGPAGAEGALGQSVSNDANDRRGMGGSGSKINVIDGEDSYGHCSNSSSETVCGGGGGGRIRVNVSEAVEESEVGGVFYPIRSGTYGNILNETEE